jgi:hypothetical protein
MVGLIGGIISMSVPAKAGTHGCAWDPAFAGFCSHISR